MTYRLPIIKAFRIFRGLGPLGLHEAICHTFQTFVNLGWFKCVSCRTSLRRVIRAYFSPSFVPIWVLLDTIATVSLKLNHLVKLPIPERRQAFFARKKRERKHGVVELYCIVFFFGIEYLHFEVIFSKNRSMRLRVPRVVAYVSIISCAVT